MLLLEVKKVEMTAGEKIRILAKRKGKSMGDIAELTNQSRQNLSNKMKRDNFTETDLREIADALGLRLDIAFINPETNERI